MLTLAKSGGGCLPRQRLDKAQTKFLVIDRRVDFVIKLQQTNTELVKQNSIKLVL